MNVLEADGLVVKAGSATILDGVGLAVAPGELVALVGPNGAGKTTLLRVLSGDLRPDRGCVRLDGRDLSTWRHRDLARRRAVLPQQSLVDLAFTVREVVTLGRTPWIGSDAEDRDAEAVDAALDAAAVRHLADRVMPTLSGGEAARATLARVLAQEAPLLFLDEPTAALDLRHQGVVLDAAGAVAAHGGAVVAVLHDLNLAACHADRIAVVCHGRLMAIGPPHAVLTEPLLREAYGVDLTVVAHPTAGHPVVLVDRSTRRTNPQEQ